MNDALPPSHLMAALALLLSERHYVLMAERQRVMTVLRFNRQARDQYLIGDWPSPEERESWKTADASLRKTLRADFFGSLVRAAGWVAAGTVLVVMSSAIKWNGSKYAVLGVACLALWATLFQLRSPQPFYKGKRLDEVLRGKLTIGLAVVAGLGAFWAALIA